MGGTRHPIHPDHRRIGRLPEPAGPRAVTIPRMSPEASKKHCWMSLTSSWLHSTERQAPPPQTKAVMHAGGQNVSIRSLLLLYYILTQFELWLTWWTVHGMVRPRRSGF